MERQSEYRRWWPWQTWVLMVVATLGAAACNGGDGTPVDDSGDNSPRAPFDATAPFPADFMWGTSTAGFQVEMGCPSAACDDSFSDWTQWVTSPLIIAKGLTNGDALSDGPGHWELFESDFDLAANVLSTTGFRLSIEWSRLFTTSTEGVSEFAALRALAAPAALEHYHDVLDALVVRGITPMVTINHYALPLWIHDGVACNQNPAGCVGSAEAPGGWLDPERLIPEMAKFAGFLGAEYGDQVDLWGTLNEPYAIVLPGYALPIPAARTNPPGIDDTTFEYAAGVIRSMIEAHAALYDALHAADVDDADADGVPVQVGLVPNLAPQQPRDPRRELDVIGAAKADYLYNHLFLEALVHGNWDEDLDGVTDVVRDDLAGRMDFVGINYYTNAAIIGLPNSVTPTIPLLSFFPDLEILAGNNFYPRGIYDVSMAVHRRYGLPIYITENGVDHTDDAAIGPGFVVPHLVWLRKAIHEGADVRGYFYWSLIDNYEWNHGYGMDFGIYSYDAVTKQRQGRPLAAVYGAVAAANALSAEQLATYAATARAEAESTADGEVATP